MVYVEDEGWMGGWMDVEALIAAVEPLIRTNNVQGCD
jgi:hypothetical protein